MKIVLYLIQSDKKNRIRVIYVCITYLMILCSGTLVHAQSGLVFSGGYLGTRTAVAEYERIERKDFLLDSLRLSRIVSSVQISIDLRQNIGSHLFLTTGFQFSQKGLNNVTFTDSTGYTWSTAARQHYLGIKLLIGYRLHPKESFWSFHLSTGALADFAIGQPNEGSLFSGPYSRFFMPVCRFNETDLNWLTVAGCNYQSTVGTFILNIQYQYGLSDVLEDPFMVARTMSWGISLGYLLPLNAQSPSINR